ncbi:hypothetical protein QBC44DRAFT_21163 [Cladorrhinum sp. PSN332]|nr:hypothetical protein QBC44DRAFT_21163 [Cladorrhinum sp. PSN332]
MLTAGRGHTCEVPQASTHEVFSMGGFGQQMASQSSIDDHQAVPTQPSPDSLPSNRLQAGTVVSPTRGVPSLSNPTPVRLPDNAEWAAETTDSHSKRDTSTTLKLQHARFAWVFCCDWRRGPEDPKTKKSQHRLTHAKWGHGVHR